MRLQQTTTARASYAIGLLRAGFDGISSVPRETGMQSALMRPAWAPLAIGAILGASTVSLNRNRRSTHHVALGGLIGCALGMGCDVVWRLRRPMEDLARNAVQRINSVRDAHWLEQNPIDYA
ncbi:MAG: hypothetical protein ACREP9_05695 [Candidatus Dormibacteraceae bacterium]